MSQSLRARIAPSVPMALELTQDDGSRLRLDFRLAFNFDCLSQFEGETGIDVLNGDIFKRVNARTLSALFWASLLPHQPEYAGRNGLAVVRSYMDPGNAATITQNVMDAFMLYLPEEQREAIRLARMGRENPTGPAPAAEVTSEAGSSSGPSPDTISISAWVNSER